MCAFLSRDAYLQQQTGSICTRRVDLPLKSDLLSLSLAAAAVAGIGIILRMKLMKWTIHHYVERITVLIRIPDA